MAAAKGGASIAQRRAAKFGFNAERISTARFRTTSPLASPAVSRSPCLTIPLALPSPTTGTFSLPPFYHESSILNSVAHEDRNRGAENHFFRFKPHGDPKYLSGHSSFENQRADVDYQALVLEQPSMDFNSQQSFLRGYLKILHFTDQTSLSKEPTHREDNGTDNLSEGNQKGSYPLVKTSEDGYNWRKYGQKQGAHNHAKPQPNRRAALGSTFSFDEMSEMGEGSGHCVKVEGGSVWTNVQSGTTDIKHGSDGKTDGLERTSSSVITDLSDPLSTTQGKSAEDGATQGSTLLGEDDDEESESKRRKKENCLIETNLASRAVREPRVVVQIESEVDILDDGYRWQNMGKKLSKEIQILGRRFHPTLLKYGRHPARPITFKSYYKCTSAGCSVRKHVERASHNLKCVITTYEGKHNHEVPAARNSNHMNSSGGNFDRKPEFSNEYLRPSFPGNFTNDMKFGAPSIYQMKFPPLQGAMPYASFGLNHNRSASQQAVSIAPVMPDFPMSLPLNLPSSGSLSMAGFDFNSGKTFVPVQPSLSGQQQQQLQENEMKFVRPKQEQKDDNLYDACLPIIDHANASSLCHRSHLQYTIGLWEVFRPSFSFFPLLVSN
ncbi:hypothetical protein FNV43_RR04616 [Rhamnella rubrinervis]|uniref:WRKY domain-containing protein n=1 Tax=Rhamnella rubrinervis TaxID=2594499 RepID=A0A8K0HMA3_9ROSA|nr:hypothetical protein FNV43_RR04616 [Rhamnella rubrinervis]